MTMALSATTTQSYKMKSHRRGTHGFRLQSSPEVKTDTPTRHVDAEVTMSEAEELREKGKEFRSRRAHKKSRMGCGRCKLARRKCDEAKPRCSRCVARDADCKYPDHPSTHPQSDQLSDPPADLDGSFWGQFHAFTLTSPPAPGSSIGTAFSSGASSAPSPLPMSPIFTPPDFKLSSRAGQALDVRELDLLSHYLSHSVRSFTYDTDDLYALQIGFPSLAFRSGLIMQSMLALAAVGKCHDILRKCNAESGNSKAARVDEASLTEMGELLSLADTYHNESLSQTQAEIKGASYREFAFANAPLMALYGLASQSIRIQVTEHHRAIGAPELPSEFTPAQSQWISLIRAAHEAHSGISAVTSDREASPKSTELSSAISSPPLGLGSTPDAGLIAYGGRSSKDTKQLLLPIISATCQRALQVVRDKAMTLHITASSQTGFVSHDRAILEQDRIHACATAIEILGEVAFKICGQGMSTAGLSPQNTPGRQSEQTVALPSWLRDYLWRVTNASPPQASHRTITSFINRVPAAFLSIVQDVLAVMPAGAGLMESIPESASLSLVERLAMDIMAHWLVFVMLLDDIWWIGEIGRWELRRVTAVLRTAGGRERAEGQWWPETICRIRDEVEKHRN